MAIMLCGTSSQASSIIIHVQMTGDKEKGGATSPGSTAHETED